MAETMTAAADDPRLHPLTKHWVRYGPPGDNGMIKRVSSLVLPRLVEQGWEEIADQGGSPLPNVPGLPVAMAPTEDTPEDPADRVDPELERTQTGRARPTRTVPRQLPDDEGAGGDA